MKNLIISDRVVSFVEKLYHWKLYVPLIIKSFLIWTTFSSDRIINELNGWHEGEESLLKYRNIIPRFAVIGTY